MDRREFLALGSSGAVIGVSGCIDELRGTDSEENGADTGDGTNANLDNGGDETGGNEDGGGYSRESICPDPPEGTTAVEYERWTTSALAHGTSSPLLEGGYHDTGSKDERLSIVTDDTRDRLNPERLDDDHLGPATGPVDTTEPTFIEETDFETSALVAFEWEWSGTEEFGIEAIDLEDDETIHLYCCRFGDPWGVGGDAEPPAGGAITFVRIARRPTAAKATYGFREYHHPEEIETFRTEVEGA